MRDTATYSFLQRILPPQGIYCAGTLYTSGAFTNIPCDTLESLVAALTHADTAGHDAYMALAAFNTPGAQKSAQNRTGLRTEANAARFQSLWIDIDVGPGKDIDGKGYTTREAAVGALGAFIESTGLPFPLVVSSGGGMHCYWPLATTLGKATWEPAALALKALCTGLGFVIDQTRTADAASVLRPVGTHNRKGGGKRPVKLLAAGDTFTDAAFFDKLFSAAAPFKHLIKAAPKATSLPVDPFFANAPAGAADEPMTAGFERDRPRALPVLRGCQQLREAGVQAEPVWHRMISVVRLLEDGREWVHKLSALDEARYSEAATDAKLDQADATQGLRGMPASCAELDAQRPGICSGCRHFSRIKSPIVLGLGPEQQAILVPPPVLVPLPTVLHDREFAEFEQPKVAPVVSATVSEYDDGFMYRMGPQGIVHLFKEKDAETGKMNDRTRHITRARVYPYAKSVTRDQHRHESVRHHFKVELPGRAPRELLLTGAEMHDTAALMKALTDKGVVVEDHKNFPVLGRFLRRYVDQQDDTLPEAESHESMGWTPAGQFVHGDKIYYPDGRVERSFPNGRTKVVVEHMAQSGELARWQEAASVVFRPGQEHGLLALGTSFAAPLMRFTESRGFLVHLVSREGGVGKSTLQRLANSVWGDPIKMQVQQVGSKVGATLNSTMARMGLHKNLPVIHEEVTNMPAEDVSDFIHMIAGGQERGRLNSSAVLKEGGSWHTAVLSSGNDFLRDKLSMAKHNPHAEGMRFIEVEAPGKIAGWEEMGARLALMDHNYGHAGAIYARWLVADDVNLSVRVQERMNYIRKHINAKQPDRFWVAYLACLLVGLELAASAGIIPYTNEVRERFEAWISGVIEQQRNAIIKSQGSEDTLVGDMINSFAGAALVTVKAYGPGAAASNEEQEAYAIMKPRGGELSMRMEKNTGDTYIAHTAMRAYCKKRNVPFRRLIELMYAGGYIKDTGTGNPEACKVALGRGVAEYNNFERVMCVKLSGAGFLRRMEEEGLLGKGNIPQEDK